MDFKQMKSEKKTEGRRTRLLRFLCIHITAFAVGFLYIFVVGCPFVKLTGISCPGCGLSRACLAVFRLDFAEAFRWYPLFFVVIPLLFLYIHEKVFFKNIPVKWKNWVLYIVCAAILLVYIVRLVMRDPLLQWNISDSYIGYIWRSFSGLGQ